MSLLNVRIYLLTTNSLYLKSPLRGDLEGPPTRFSLPSPSARLCPTHHWSPRRTC
jgi:hypothetical protein